MATGVETSHEGTLYQAVISATYTIKKHLDLKKMAPLMYDEKTISKKVRKLFKASEKTNNMEYFIQALLSMNVNGFAMFFLSLEKLGDENHQTILSVMSTELQSVNLSKLIKVPSDADAVKIIERVRSIYFRESIHQGLPEGMVKNETQGLRISSEIEEPQQFQHGQSVIEEQAMDVSSGSIITEISTVGEHPHKQGSEVITTFIPPSPTEKYHSDTHECSPELPVDLKFNPKHETFTFSRLTQCDTFYSSAHGVSVTIPKQSFPPNVSEFKLTMTASLESSLPIDQQYYSPCSAIVSLECNPPIEEFADYVTVEIPHCVLNVSECKEYLCVLSSPDDDSKAKGAKFEEDEDIEVDFTDGRYLMFKTKHFSRFLIVVLKRKRKQRRFSSQKKSSIEMRTRSRSSPVMPRSFEHSIQRSQSHPVSSSIESKSSSAIVEFCVAMFTPRIKEDEKHWKVVFPVACCAVPTAWEDLERCALKVFGLDHKLEQSQLQCDFKQFIFHQPFIQFIPACLNTNGWSVKAASRPAVIARNVVEGFFMKSKEYRESSLLTPHCQQYVVERVSDTPGDLKMEITVEGADCYGEQVVFTLLQPSLCPTTAVGEIEIPSIIDLYSEDSLIRRALCDTDDTTTADSVLLSLDDRDSVSFLAELSFHLPNWMDIAKFLTIEQTDIDNIDATFSRSNQWQFEAAFQMLKTWTIQKCPNTSLSILLDALQRAEIVIKQRSWRNLSWCQQMDTSCSPLEVEKDDSQFIFFLRTRLPRQIASQWMFVARFLGIKEQSIANICEDKVGSYGPELVVQQAREMLAEYKSRGLSFWLLRDSIHAVYEHSSGCLRDALYNRWFIA